MRKNNILKILILLLALTMLVTPALADESAEPGLVNGALADPVNGIPSGWKLQSYQQQNYVVQTEEGTVMLRSGGPNDLRIMQTVEVQPDTAYVLRAEISTTAVSGGRGATLSIDNVWIDGTCLYSEGLYGDADFCPVELAFRTTGTQQAVQIALRLGGYSEDSQGTAFFRNVSLSLADDSTRNIQLLQPWTVISQPEAQTPETGVSEAHRIFLKSLFSVMVDIFVVTLVVLLFGIYRNRKRIGGAAVSRDRSRKIFILLVMIGFAVRSVLCSVFEGHDTDMNCWIAWGSDIAANGPGQFYTAPGHEWYDYPPGYMLVLAALSKILSVLGIPAHSDAGLFFFMLPAFAADIASAVILMRFARERGWSEAWCLLLGGLVVLNPAVFYLSGAWGQIDSVLTLFLLLSIRELSRNDRIGAGALFGLAISIKWQALMYGPVLAAAYLLTLRRPRDIVHTVLGVLAAIAVIFIVGLPFQGDQGPLWLVDRFLNATGGYNYASVEAYNFQALCGGNWTSADSDILPGISYKQFGTAAIILSVLAVLYMQFRWARRSLVNRRPAMEESGMTYLAAALCMFAIFTFGHYMHERYVFPAVLLLLFAFVFYKDKRLLICTMLLSSVLFLNEMCAMYVVSDYARDVVRSGLEHNGVVRLCSFAETLSFIYFAYVCTTLKDRREEAEA